MKKTLLTLSLLITSVTFAEEIPDYSRFEDITRITVRDITTPKVVRFSTPLSFDNQTVLLDESQTIIPHRWIRKSEKVKTQNIESAAASSIFEGQPMNIIDGNYQTSLTFHPENDPQPFMVINFKEETEVSGIYIHLDDGIIAPQKVSVLGDFGDGKFTNIINRQKFAPRIPFPKVTLTALKVSYETPHFFRVSEIEILGQEETEKTDELVFFAEEGKTYTLYSNAHFGQKIYRTTKTQPLSTDSKTPVFTLPRSTKNPTFNNDYDGDGLSDRIDLCPKIADPKNTDFDRNGRGDACEDPDQDGKMSVKDNCPFKYNPDQVDSDADTLGDACDEEENRVSEDSEYLLYIVFSIAALFLGFLAWRSLKK